MLTACRLLRAAPPRLTGAAAGRPSPPAIGCCSPRGFADEAAAPTPEPQRRRLWRWGGTSSGMMSEQQAAEISKDPTLVEDVSGVTAIGCGTSHSAFVVDGQLFTYGSNKYQQLGWAAPAEDNASGLGHGPEVVKLEAADGHKPAVQEVALGAYHSAVITEGGALWTWGWGGSFWWGAGALGHSGREGASEPTLVQSFVESGEEVKQVACGSQHTIVLTSEGRLYSTGKGDFGRLGRGDTRDATEFEEIEYFFQSNDSVLSPHDPTVIVKVGAGKNFTAAMSSQGELWVWGRNDYGQLGLGEEAMGDMYSAERYPRLVRSLPIEGHRVVDFDCGECHLVALTASGSIYEWGNRTWLEPHPVTLPSRYEVGCKLGTKEAGLKNIVKVAAGENCSFALNAEGQVYSWGSKSSGCLAQGEDGPKNLLQPAPVSPAVFGHQQVVDITASKCRCLAITLEDTYVPEG